MRNYFATITAGLEERGALALREDISAEDARCDFRIIRFRSSAPLTRFLGVRCVDDIFFCLGTLSGIGHERSSLEVLARAVLKLSFECALSAIEELRTLTDPLRIGVTASFLGSRNYSRWEISEVVGRAVANQLGGLFVDRRPERLTAPGWRAPHIDLRIILHGSEASVGVRLGERPLYKREYRRAQIPGAVNPVVAHHMIRMLELRDSCTLLDPSLGSGTILIEGVAQNPKCQSIGGDLEIASLRASQINAAAASCRLSLYRGSFFTLPFARESMDAIASNPPWEGQVATGHGQGGAPPPLPKYLGELCRVLRPHSRMVLLTDRVAELERNLADTDLETEEIVPLSLYGRHPSLFLLRKVG